MNKIQQYEVIASNSLEAFTKMVALHIEEGWQPFGSMQVTRPTAISTDGARYLQPMVKYIPEETEND